MPEKLALSFVLGCLVGVFPVQGTTTILCIAVAAALRLNQVAIQIGNLFAYPLLFALIIPFVRLGEFALGAAPLSFSVTEFARIARAGPWRLFLVFSDALWHAVVGWIIAAPPAAAVLFFLTLPLFRKWQVRMASS
jgi:uncharacterized protein (DUF2062 family)